MSNTEHRIRDLETAVEEALAILRRHGVVDWTSKLEQVLALLSRRDARGLERLLAMFGGMGSLNDVVVSRLNGHNISELEEGSVNRTLRTRLSRAYSLAHDLLRETY
jgi:hypothetical protein